MAIAPGQGHDGSIQLNDDGLTILGLSSGAGASRRLSVRALDTYCWQLPDQPERQHIKLTCSLKSVSLIPPIPKVSKPFPKKH